jgi:hypothetical protein
LSIKDKRALVKEQLSLLGGETTGKEVTESAFTKRVVEAFARNSWTKSDKPNLYYDLLQTGLRMVNDLPENQRNDVKKQNEIIATLLLSGGGTRAVTAIAEGKEFIPDDKPENIPPKARFNLQTMRYEYGDRQWDIEGKEKPAILNWQTGFEEYEKRSKEKAAEMKRRKEAPARAAAARDEAWEESPIGMTIFEAFMGGL